jgi:hypothetical protein
VTSLQGVSEGFRNQRKCFRHNVLGREDLASHYVTVRVFCGRCEAGHENHLLVTCYSLRSRHTTSPRCDASRLQPLLTWGWCPSSILEIEHKCRSHKVLGVRLVASSMRGSPQDVTRGEYKCSNHKGLEAR